MTNTDLDIDPAPLPPASSSNPTRKSKAYKLLHTILLAAGGVFVWLMTWLAIGRTVGLGMVTLSLIVPSACVILFGLIALRQEQTWVWPVRELAKMLPDIRSGTLPIETLSNIEGALRPVAMEMRAVFLELRQQETKLAELEMEIRQRLANRTDAMERTIGSLRAQATRDALTGLYNRRMFDQYLPRAVSSCEAEGANLALLMIDVDYFKMLNDTLGHAAGDELLRDIGQIIRSTIREHDAGFRCGGDEFVVVLPRCSQENATAMAERLRSLVAGLTKPLRLPQQPRLSIGVATINELPEASPTALMELADKRLYEIKGARKVPSRPAATLSKAG